MKTNLKIKVTGLIAILALAAVPALAFADATPTEAPARTAAVHTNLTVGEYRAYHTADPMVRFNAIDGQPLR